MKCMFILIFKLICALHFSALHLFYAQTEIHCAVDLAGMHDATCFKYAYFTVY